MYQLSEKNDPQYLIKTINSKRTVLIGVGNPFMQDDAAGSLLAQRLSGKISAEVYDAGSAPENYVGKVTKSNPECIVVIDAVDFGQPPGVTAVIPKERIKLAGLSTHDISIRLFMDLLEKDSSAEVYLLAIQPKSVKFGEGMCKEVEEAVSKLEQMFKNET